MKISVSRMLLQLLILGLLYPLTSQTNLRLSRRSNSTDDSASTTAASPWPVEANAAASASTSAAAPTTAAAVTSTTSAVAATTLAAATAASTAAPVTTSTAAPVTASTAAPIATTAAATATAAPVATTSVLTTTATAAVSGAPQSAAAAPQAAPQSAPVISQVPPVIPQAPPLIPQANAVTLAPIGQVGVTDTTAPAALTLDSAPCPNISVTPCPTLNNTAILQRIQNSAMISSAAAQASVDAVEKLGKDQKLASANAEQASHQAKRANVIWENAYNSAQEASRETGMLKAKLHTLDQMMAKGVEAYSNAMNSGVMAGFQVAAAGGVAAPLAAPQAAPQSAPVIAQVPPVIPSASPVIPQANAVTVAPIGQPGVLDKLAPAALSIVPAPCPNISVTPCPTLNNTAILQHMQNSAMLASAADQVALDNILKLGRSVASPKADEASAQAKRANAIWEKAYKSAQEASHDTEKLKVKLRTLDKMMTKGFQAYSNALNNVEIVPPTIPSVH